MCRDAEGDFEMVSSQRERERRKDRAHCSFGKSSASFDVLVNGEVVHTNTWLTQGFFSTADANRQEFVRKAITDAMAGRALDTSELKKEIKAARNHAEKVALDEANEKSIVAKANRLAEEERVRKERALKLQKENARIEAEEEERQLKLEEATKARAAEERKAKAAAKKESSVQGQSEN
jgi:hypothetical protein